MPVPIEKNEMRKLTAFTSRSAPVVSVFLDVDGETYPRPQQYVAAYQALAKSALKQWQRDTDPGSRQVASARSELSKVGSFLGSTFVRERTKGLVVYTCGSEGLWRVVNLPVTVPSKVVVGREAYTHPLSALLDKHDRFCAVVVDRRKARVFTAYLSDIDEHVGLISDDVPGHVKGGEWAGLRGNKIVHHIEDHVHRHLKKVSDQLLEFFKSNRFDRLIVGGHPDFTPRFLEHLHPYLAERVVGTFPADPAMPINRVLEESLKVEREARVKSEQDMIDKLSDGVGPHARAVLGLRDTIDALMNDEAYTLVIGADFQASAFHCGTCRTLSVEPGDCPACSRQMSLTEDVAEDLAQAAVGKGLKVYQITEHRDFSVDPGVGAILRYPS